VTFASNLPRWGDQFSVSPEKKEKPTQAALNIVHGLKGEVRLKIR